MANIFAQTNELTGLMAAYWDKKLLHRLEGSIDWEIRDEPNEFAKWLGRFKAEHEAR
jgi:hypothetical protein